MPERYEFTLPDGRSFDSEKSPEEIRRIYPDARITAVVTLDEQDAFVSREAFTGKQPKAVDAPADEAVDATTTTTTTPAPAKAKSK